MAITAAPAALRALINLGLRGLTLGSRFLLLFVLATWLPPADVGTYGLVSAVVGYGIYVAGWEFYTYAGRALIASDAAERSRIVGQLGFFYLFAYLLSLCVLGLAALAGVLPAGYVGWIAALLLFEFLAQEVHRNLVALSRQLTASLVLFVRMGAWCLAVMALMWLQPDAREVPVVLAGWLAFAILACALGYTALLREVRPQRPGRVDWRWMRVGLVAAAPLFLASLAARGLVTFDRFLIEDIGGLEVLGAYVLYAGVAMAVLSFIDAGVVDFCYPELVARADQRNLPAFRASMAQARWRLVLMTALLVSAAVLLVHTVVPALNRAVYLEQLPLLHLLAAATTIQALSLIPHLGLYALRHDRPILHSQLAGLAAFCLCAWLARPWGVAAVPLALCAAWTTILLWKAVAYRQAMRYFPTPRLES